MCCLLAVGDRQSVSRWETAVAPTLVHLIQRSVQDVPHPTDSQKTPWDAHFDLGPCKGPMDAEFAHVWDTKTSNEPPIGPLGSGSDYTVFSKTLRLLFYTLAGHSA